MEKEWRSIQEWTHAIFVFHQKEITKEIMGQLKHTLISHSNKNYYTFKTNEQRAVIISFNQGEVVISQQNKRLIVTIDEKTKKAVYDLKEAVQNTQEDEHFDAIAQFSEETF